MVERSLLRKKCLILAADDVESLTKAVQRMEYSILPEAIKNVSTNTDES